MPRRSIIDDLFTSATNAARIFKPDTAARSDTKDLIGYQRWQRHNKTAPANRHYDTRATTTPTHIQPAPTGRVSANDPYAALSREMAYDASARAATGAIGEERSAPPIPTTSATGSAGSVIFEYPPHTITKAPSQATRHIPPAPPPMRDVPPPPVIVPPKVPVVSRLGLSVPFASEREPKRTSAALVPYVAPKSVAAPLAQAKTQMPIPPAEALSNDTISRAVRRPAKYSLKSGQAQNMRGITRGAQIAALSLVGGPK